MTARDSHVAGQPPDWRADKPGHKAPARRLPKAVRKALRDYRRKVIPMAGEPRSLIDSWPFLVCGSVVAIAILLARAWGLLP